MPRRSGFEPCQGSATYKWSPMGEFDTYLEFYMSKDSIVQLNLELANPVQHRDSLKVARVQKCHPGDTLATTWRQPGDNLATPWRQPGARLSGHWSPDPSPGSWEPD